MTEYRIVNNDGQWQQLAGPDEANEALDKGYNVMVTDPPTPGGEVVTPTSGRRF